MFSNGNTQLIFRKITTIVCLYNYPIFPHFFVILYSNCTTKYFIQICQVYFGYQTLIKTKTTDFFVENNIAMNMFQCFVFIHFHINEWIRVIWIWKFLFGQTSEKQIQKMSKFKIFPNSVHIYKFFGRCFCFFPTRKCDLIILRK